MLCTHCDNPLDPKANFCVACGKPVFIPVPPQKQSEEQLMTANYIKKASRGYGIAYSKFFRVIAVLVAISVSFSPFFMIRSFTRGNSEMDIISVLLGSLLAILVYMIIDYNIRLNENVAITAKNSESISYLLERILYKLENPDK